LEDVGHGGMKMAGGAAVKATIEMDVMTGAKDMKSDVRK